MDIETPKHLSKAMQAFFAKIAAEYQLETHHIKMLTLACEAADRCEQARQQIKKNGLMFTDRFGQQKLTPLAGVERDSRLAFARMIRELGLDTENPDDVRIPRIAGQRGDKLYA